MSTTTAAATVYGGDEINAVVLDPGSYVTRIGFAGDDFPKVVAPSHYALDPDGSRSFEGALDYAKAGRDIMPIMNDGLIDDWDGAMAHYRHYFDGILALDYHEQPILITEPVWATQKYRQRLVETFFEEFEFPALYLAKAPTCISFQQGRSSCLIVDIGHSTASAVPVVDGMCLLKHSLRTHYAGQFLNDHIRSLLLTKQGAGLDLTPKFRIKDKTATEFPSPAVFTPREFPQGVTQSFEDYQREKIFTEFKELMLEAPEKKIPSNPTSTKDQYLDEEHTRTMEVPSGQTFEVTRERFSITDALFEPESHPFTDDKFVEKYPPNNGEFKLSGPYDDYRPTKRTRKGESGQATPTPLSESGVEIQDGKSAAHTSQTQIARGISSMISSALSSVDIDLRPSVAYNVIVTGGTSLIPQLAERLNAEVSASSPGLKVRLHALGNSHERTSQAWIGGSVLASLGSFHQMWVSKAEYEEVGPDRIFTQRFR